mmetsp:Transcript_60222/g.196792  ORF Transcript_60222/g.196792 Transcript_60222/m.196792 type:complete len:324 (-) Transcript_60222:2412-3383(-)
MCPNIGHWLHVSGAWLLRTTLSVHVPDVVVKRRRRPPPPMLQPRPLAWMLPRHPARPWRRWRCRRRCRGAATEEGEGARAGCGGRGGGARGRGRRGRGAIGPIGAIGVVAQALVAKFEGHPRLGTLPSGSRDEVRFRRCLGRRRRLHGHIRVVAQALVPPLEGHAWPGAGEGGGGDEVRWSAANSGRRCGGRLARQNDLGSVRLHLRSHSRSCGHRRGWKCRGAGGLLRRGPFLLLLLFLSLLSRLRHRLFVVPRILHLFLLLLALVGVSNQHVALGLLSVLLLLAFFATVVLEALTAEATPFPFLLRIASIYLRLVLLSERL